MNTITELRQELRDTRTHYEAIIEEVCAMRDQLAAERDEAIEIVGDLRDIQNGCPLATWQEEFDVINAKADKILGRTNKGET